MIRRLVRVVGPGGLVTAALLVALPAADAGKRDDTVVREINARWEGARCRLLFDIPIKKKTNSEGWAKSAWIVPAEGRKVRKGTTAALMWVSDRSAAPGGVLRAGTTFIADGWAFRKPKSLEGIFLELRVEGSPARARFEPVGSWGKSFDLKALPDIDRWVRMDILNVSAADERLVEVAEAPPAPAVASTVPTAPGLSAAPELTILGTTAEPLAVSPGQTIDLVVTYEVSGVPPGRSIEVLEQRTILRDGEVLTTLEAAIRRGPGTHRSTQSLTVPAALELGVLEMRSRVSGAGVESSGETLFQVRRP